VSQPNAWSDLKRRLAQHCPVDSNECAIRAMCTNKCGQLDPAKRERVFAADETSKEAL